MTSNSVSFQTGVFQGDTMIPRLLCFALLSISIALYDSRGYPWGKPNHREHMVSNVFYMDDLTSEAKQLQNALSIVKSYTGEIGMDV